MSWAAGIVVALAAFTGLGASARSTVWSATSGAGTLQVFDDDSYTLLLGSDVWLESGPTSVHVSGVWFSTASAACGSALQCRDFADTDCHGNDLFFFNSTSPEDCCANCSATPGCGAWTYTGTTRNVPPWAQRCYIKSSCDGRQAYVGHTSGLPAGSGGAPLPLTRMSAGRVGDGWGITYAAASPNFPSVSFSVTFSVENGGFIFEQLWPQGAPGVNITVPVNSTNGLTEFDSSAEPATQFPVFVEAANSSVSSSLGYLSWAGRFFPTLTAMRGGAAAAFSAVAQGAESGPIVLFDGPVNALVMSANANFKSHMIGQSSIAPRAAAAGISGYVTSLPPGFATSTVVGAGSAGITDAIHAWGGALQRRYNTSKIPDPASTGLSYWTDNGAYYDWYAYEPDVTSKGVPEDILVALSQTFKNGTYGSSTLPVRSYMLDAYWYYNTRANANCAMNFTTWPLPFPGGLSSLSEDLGAPLIMYNGPVCGNTTLAKARWTIEPSLYWDQGWGAGVLGIVTSEQSNAFYTELMDSLLAQGMSTFTQDFLDFQGLLFPTTLVDPIGNGGWMKGQADAALAAGVAVQYCMGLPADMLASVAFNAVTNARASDDYGAGGENWKIGGSSLLLSALGMRASKDNFWTSCCNDRGGEKSPYLVAIVSALSGGPVGFADALFATDPAVLWPTMAANGTLLHASRPATAIDAQFVGGLPLSVGDVRAAHSAVATTGSSSSVLFHTILAAELPASVNLPLVLTMTDLWPLPTASELLIWQFNSSACAEAGPASSCVSFVGGARSAATATPSTDKVAWTLYFIAPVQAGGYTLLGEVGKYVAVSPDRFSLVAAAQPFGVHVELVGAPNEVVTLSYVVPGGSDPLGKIAVKSLTLGLDGRIAADLT
jgi:hypothetical protein